MNSNRVARKVCKIKLKEHSKLVDLQIKMQFCGAIRSIVKCMISYNYCGKRYKALNYSLPTLLCPKCKEEEI